MIEVTKAIEIAKLKAKEFSLGDDPQLEEIERGVFQGKDAWNITLSVPEVGPNSLAAITGRRYRRYKRFVIEASTGDFLAMQIRDVAA